MNNAINVTRNMIDIKSRHNKTLFTHEINNNFLLYAKSV